VTMLVKYIPIDQIRECLENTSPYCAHHGVLRRVPNDGYCCGIGPYACSSYKNSVNHHNRNRKALRKEDKVVHELKIEENYLTHILEGRKTFEIRFNDRDYQVGDKIEFTPIMRTDNKIPKRDCLFIITYLTDYEQQTDYVVFGIKPLKESP